MSQRKKPTYRQQPAPSRKPIIAEDVNSLESQYFKWCASKSYVDYDVQEWGWRGVTMKRFFYKCLKYLQHYEDMTWAQLKQKGHCHPVAINDIAPRAQNRINTEYAAMSDLYQVKAEGRCRLFGCKDRQIFYLIWHDEHHTVYPRGA